MGAGRRVPGAAARGEDELVARVVPPPASVLDLGSGPGRIANALVRRGYVVVAVDDSEEMLRHVQGAETVLGDVGSLRLGRRFDCVLLASHFVNEADDAGAVPCSRHARPSRVGRRAGRRGVSRVARLGGRRRPPYALVTWSSVSRRQRVSAISSRRRWRTSWADESGDSGSVHACSTRRLAPRASSAGLGFDSWVDRGRGWFTARREPSFHG